MAENQQTRASLEQQLRLKEEEKLRIEKEVEIAQLQEQMKQLATEKEREMAELRRKLETSQRTLAKRVSKPEASVVDNILCYNQTISLVCELCLRWRFVNACDCHDLYPVAMTTHLCYCNIHVHRMRKLSMMLLREEMCLQ